MNGVKLDALMRRFRLCSAATLLSILPFIEPIHAIETAPGDGGSKAFLNRLTDFSFEDRSIDPIFETILELVPPTPSSIQTPSSDSRDILLRVMGIDGRTLAGAKLSPAELREGPARLQLFEENLLVPRKVWLPYLPQDLTVSAELCEIERIDKEERCSEGSQASSAVATARVVSIGDGTRSIRLIPYMTLK